MLAIELDDWAQIMFRDLAMLVCGDKIGWGEGRTVYVCNLNPVYVVKVEYRGESFQNAIEWETWERYKDTRHEKWLAPCHSISPCGQMLLQRRTSPLRAKEMPRRVPAWLPDVKADNWGMFDGRPVCHDYGLLPIGLKDGTKPVIVP